MLESIGGSSIGDSEATNSFAVHISGFCTGQVPVTFLAFTPDSKDCIVSICLYALKVLQPSNWVRNQTENLLSEVMLFSRRWCCQGHFLAKVRECGRERKVTLHEKSISCDRRSKGKTISVRYAPPLPGKELQPVASATEPSRPLYKPEGICSEGSLQTLCNPYISAKS